MDNLSSETKQVNTGLGHVVKVIRAERGMSQKELADAAHVGIATVTRLESGAQVTRSTLENIARALGTTHDEMKSRSFVIKAREIIPGVPSASSEQMLKRIEQKVDHAIRLLEEDDWRAVLPFAWRYCKFTLNEDPGEKPRYRLQAEELAQRIWYLLEDDTSIARLLSNPEEH